MATLIDLIEAVTDNNRMNDGCWRDWSDLCAIEEVYGGLDDEDVSRAEAERVIDSAITSNGTSLCANLANIELGIKGQNFAGSRWDRQG